MKKIVIIGGGFAGSTATKKLEKDFHVTLIDTKDYFEFTPGILRTIVESKHIRKIQVLHTHYLKRAKVIVGEVAEVAKKYVRVGNKLIGFNYLIICSGSSYASPIKEQHFVIATRARNLRNCYEDLCKAKRVLIIGGGLVGVELTGEILWRYKRKKKITIVHSKDRLIERNPLKASKYAENYLKRKGVKIFYNEKFIEAENGVYFTDKGRKIKTDIAFLCTGIVPNFDFIKKNFPNALNKKNQIKVNGNLQLIGKKNIFVAGDVNDAAVEKTAQNAERQAEVVVRNIYALERREELSAYACKKTPLVISLGKYNGLFVSGDFVFTGKIPALMKALIEDWEMWKKGVFKTMDTYSIS